jgi:hypothetical protein
MWRWVPTRRDLLLRSSVAWAWCFDFQNYFLMNWNIGTSMTRGFPHFPASGVPFFFPPNTK